MGIELETKVLVEQILWERFEVRLDVSVSRLRKGGQLLARTRYGSITLSGRGVDPISCSNSLIRSYDMLVNGAQWSSTPSKTIPRKSYYHHTCTRDSVKQELSRLNERRKHLENLVVSGDVDTALQAWQERVALMVKIETKEKQLKVYDTNG